MAMLTQSYTPKNIVWKGFEPVQFGCVVKSDQVVAKGTLMAIHTASGHVVPYDADGTDDGRRTPVGFLTEDVDTSSAGFNREWPSTLYCVHGFLLLDKLTGTDAAGLAAIGAREVIDNVLYLGGAPTVSGVSVLTGGAILPITAGTDTAMAITAAMNSVHCADFTAARTYALPASATYGIGRLLVIVAPSNANTYNLTLDGNASETIAGAATKIISTALGPVVLQAITGGWAVISGS